MKNSDEPYSVQWRTTHEQRTTQNMNDSRAVNDSSEIPGDDSRAANDSSEIPGDDSRAANDSDEIQGDDSRRTILMDREEELSMNVKKPYVGMSFCSRDDARNHYAQYGREQGFSIRVRNSSKSGWRGNEVTSTKFVCAREGKIKKIIDEERSSNTKRRTSSIKCGCLAKICIVLDKNTSCWVVSKFEDIHNHKQVTPSKRMKMRSNRTMPEAVKNLTEAFHRENLKVSKLPDVIGGDHIGFGKRDCYNHLRNVRQKNMEGGDAQTVLNYFKKKQLEDPNFFYDIEVDEHGRAVNFFWVDHHARMAYEYFGDVVTFDTTYKTNKYDMPFAPFTGINHHFQSIQFGCALLHDEKEATFVWLFRVWLQAMGGRAPKAFITDQDKAMLAAIPQVFPNTRHRLCIWHIKKKFAEKLSHLYFKKSKFKTEMKICLKNTYRVEDFEERWKKLVEGNSLQENSWLTHLYDIRSSWVPVYNRDTFFAGMNTTGRSEGVNAFFDDFVTHTTNLRDFVVKYDQALKKIMKNESDEDYVTEHKVRIVSDHDYLLKDASKYYTRNIFNKFKAEFDAHRSFKVEREDFYDGSHTYLVKHRECESDEFVVNLDLNTLQGKCECQNFEFVGILCRHIIKVLLRHDIDKIPLHFILTRWRVGANKYRILDVDGCVANDALKENESLRLSYMCQQSTKLACEVAPSYEHFQIYMECINLASKKIAEAKMEMHVSLDDVCGSGSDVVCQSGHEMSSNDTSSRVFLLDPSISQTKGRKKDDKGEAVPTSSKRLKSGIEISQNKKRKCAICHGFGHDKRNCPMNPDRKKNDSDDNSVLNE